jgi:hypothetical protein
MNATNTKKTPYTEESSQKGMSNYFDKLGFEKVIDDESLMDQMFKDFVKVFPIIAKFVPRASKFITGCIEQNHITIENYSLPPESVKVFGECVKSGVFSVLNDMPDDDSHSWMINIIEMCGKLHHIDFHTSLKRETYPLPQEFFEQFANMKPNKGHILYENTYLFWLRHRIHFYAELGRTYKQFCEFLRKNNHVVHIVDKYSSYVYPEINFDMYPSDIESTYQLLSKIHQTFTETTNPISKEDYTQKINNLIKPLVGGLDNDNKLIWEFEPKVKY